MKKLFAVTDTETTGLNDKDQVLELAICCLDDHGRDMNWSTLLKPSCPINVEALAVHHITDAMLADCWDLPRMMSQRGLEEYVSKNNESIFVAHNAPFDIKMLLQSFASFEIDNCLPVRNICTYRCAQHVWPDAPSFKNQVLRYWLKLEIPEITTLPPHRAMPDAVVTRELLLRLLDERDAEELITLTQTLPLLLRVGFGKYQGKLWADMDRGFLNWVAGRDFPPAVIHTAKHYLGHAT